MAGAAPMIQFRQEMVLGFAQRQSLLKDVTTSEAVVKGNQATFLVADSSHSAVTRGVNGLIPATDNDNTQVTITLAERHSKIRMTDFNIFQSQGNQSEIMQINTMAALNRDMDQSIINALDTATITTGSAATASLNMINKALVYLQGQGVAMDGNVFGVITPAFLGYLMSVQQFSSADFVVVKPAVNFPGWDAMSPSMQAGMGQGWYNWMGVKWIVSNQLTGIGTSSEKCYLFHRNAIGHAADSRGMDVVLGYDDEDHYSFSRTTLYHAATKLQNNGIVQMLHDGSALIAS
jgi:hypothetical protein